MGIEGAIHGMRESFEEMSSRGYGLLMVDATNAFNFVNRAASLWYCGHYAQGYYSTTINLLFYHKGV